MKILIINGPNLNLLGNREPEVYGNTSFEFFFEGLIKKFHDHSLSYQQSNVEGEIINYLHAADKLFDFILLNAAAYTHTSVAIADAVAAISTPVIEIHISNPAAREPYRQTNLLTSKCKAIVSGFGLNSYRIAIEGLILLNN